jgi:PAS domain S-box-containing protein
MQIIEASIDAIRVINKDFTIRCINRAFAEMTGVNQDEVTGKKCWEVFPSPLCHTSECRLQRILDGEDVVHVEIRRRNKEGINVPCAVTTSPLVDEKGVLNGAIEQFRDITERLHMEDQVKEAEALFSALVHLETEANEAIVILQDIDGKEGAYTFISDQWPVITGYTREELHKQSFFDVLKEENREGSIRRHRTKISGGAVPGLFEMTVIRKDGTEKSIELTGSPTLYKGNPANVAFIRDITQRKTLETLLKTEKDRYQNLFQNAPVAIMEGDYSSLKKFADELKALGVTDFKKYFNEHLDEILKRKWILGKMNSMNTAVITISEATSEDEVNSLRQLAAQEKNATFDVHIDTALKLAEGLYNFTKEEEIITFKGNRKVIQTNVMVAPGHEDSLSSVYTCFWDITSLKESENIILESERKYRDLFQNVPIAVTEMDFSETKGRFDELRQKGVTDFRQYFNDNPEECCKCEALAKWVNINNEVFKLWDASNFDEMTLAATSCRKDHSNCGAREAYIGLAEGKTEFSYESYQKTYGNNWKYFHVQLMVAPGYENSLARVYTWFIDITERKIKEQELDKYREHLETIVEQRTKQLRQEIEQRKEAEINLKKLYKTQKQLYQDARRNEKERIGFMRSLVHELKTPLTTLVVASDTIASMTDNDQFLPLVKNIQRGSIAINTRINELMLLSKGEMGILRVHLSKLDLRKVIMETVQYIEPRVSETRQKIALDIPETPLFVRGDKDRLTQVLLNLLDNAIKFTSDSGSIGISASNLGNEIVVDINDTGQGITGAQQKRLFKPYYHKARDQKQYSGLGLGLALCKTILDLHDGTISVQSTPGQGSTFSFRLPAWKNSRNNPPVATRKIRQGKI